MKHSRFFKPLFGVLLALSFVFQGTWALAGTTGSVNGTLTDSSTGKPVADATVVASSPSQTATTKTDNSGHFAFLSLAPDTYSVSASKPGYAPVSIAGVTVFADQSQNLALTTQSQLKTITHIVSRAAGNLVKSGTTSDVYSVNAATQQTVASVGGGYNMNQAYSAIYSQPGVTSYVGNYGQGQTFYIRGASYGQTGYEFDGVPVNRAFDNYNGNTLSNLGQQELQVYTGGSPASGASATLGGYINQVIKTGTYPGFGTLTGGIGAPTFYHQLMAEAGGASPNRLFSYYVGLSGYNQDYRTLNNQDGGNINPNGMNPYGFFGTEGNVYAAFNTGFYGNGPFPACPNLSAPNDPTGYPTSSATGAPMCLAYGPYAAGFNVMNTDREAVANFHFGIPHKYDSGRDDLQLLYDVGAAHSIYADSINDLGGLGAFQNLFSFIDPNLNNSACAMTGLAAAYGYSGGQCAVGGPSPFPYQDGYIFANGTTFGENAGNAKVVPYYFPSSSSNRALYSGIPLNQRDAIWNDMAIVKLQYQKNIGSNAYARIYGYTFYSDWLQNGPNEASLYYGLAGFGFGANGDYPSPDYELMTHTRGLSFEYANQINSDNLLQFNVNYTTAGLNRFNNQTWLGNSLNKTSTNLTNGDPSNPICYNGLTAVAAPGNDLGVAPGTVLVQGGAQNSCFSGYTAGTYGSPTQVPLTYGICGATTASNTPEATCSAATAAGAQYEVTQPEGRGTLNQVTPKFTTASIQDDFRPNDKLDLNVGVRFERYQYDLQNSNTPMNNFWFNAAAQVYCYDPATGQPLNKPVSPNNPPPVAPVTTAPGAACPVAPSGQMGVHPDGQNGHLLYSAVSAPSFAYNVFSPRIGGTYTFNPDTVLRFTLGRYTQPTPAAFEQYLDQAGRYAAQTDFSRFFGFGFTNPGHNNSVQTSNNVDFSIEKRLHGTDVTFKLSPFFRYTTHQSVSVPLGPNFVSAVNLGTQRSEGVEFQVQKGDPSRDGFSGAVSYTYTNAKIRYENAPNGFNAIDTVNNYIKAYNALTQAGGGAACYDPTSVTATGNAPDPSCSKATDIANPYYNLPQQSLLNRNGWYDTFPNAPPEDAPAFGGTSAISPNFFTGWLNYKHGRFDIAPNFVLSQGQSYGNPTAMYGVDPRTCADNQAGANGVTPPVAGAGSQYAQDANYYSCGASLATSSGYLAIPDPYTGAFDGVGQYREPWQFNLGAMLRYDISPKITATLNVANIYNRCFGGSSTAWSKAFPANNYVCGYEDYNAYSWTGTQPGAGFFYGASPTDPANGTQPFSKALLYPYNTYSGALPFQAYLQVQVRL